jgi:RNA polymerase sigma factor (sigma-70 family)
MTASIHADQPPDRTPLATVVEDELSRAIRHAIDQLAPRRREVFTLFHLQDLSYKEIADLMGIRPQSVANHLQAALADLRVSLRDHLPAPAPGISDRSRPPASA